MGGRQVPQPGTGGRQGPGPGPGTRRVTGLGAGNNWQMSPAPRQVTGPGPRPGTRSGRGCDGWLRGSWDIRTSTMTKDLQEPRNPTHSHPEQHTEWNEEAKEWTRSDHSKPNACLPQRERCGPSQTKKGKPVASERRQKRKNSSKRARGGGGACREPADCGRVNQVLIHTMHLSEHGFRDQRRVRSLRIRSRKIQKPRIKGKRGRWRSRSTRRSSKPRGNP